MHYPVGYNRSLMIVLLVAYIIRVGRCLPADVLSADAAVAAPDSATNPTDPTTAATDSKAAATDQLPSAGDGKVTTYSKCKMELYKSLSTFGIGAEMLLKGFSQATLTVVGALFGAIGGLIGITATTGEKLASGLNLVNSKAGKVLLVGDVTSGVATLANDVTSSYRKSVDFGIKNGDELFDTLDQRLTNYHPETETFLQAPATAEGSADGKSTDTKAPPTNDNVQPTEPTAETPPTNLDVQATETTATEAAPEAIPKVQP